MGIDGLSMAIVKRLPLYHHLFKILWEDGEEYVSSASISKVLGFTEITIRKDLSSIGAIGRSKIGFHIESTLEFLEDALGWNNLVDAVLVGCGNLGKALLNYKRFEEYGFKIVAVFDNDPNKINFVINGKKVFHIKRMEELIDRMKIQVAILTVPRKAAQSITNRLIDAGIKGIWNFSPTVLNVPEGIVVQQENMIASLVILFNRVKNL